MLKKNIVDTNNIFTIIDTPEIHKKDMYDYNNLSFWKSYTATNEEGPYEELNVLMKLLDYADQEEFVSKISEIVNLQKIYRWQVLNVLSSSIHQSSNNNIVLLFKKETGMFELVPWNVNMFPPKGYAITKNANKLIRRILSYQPFYDDFIVELKNYLTDENIKDDIMFFDNLHKKYKGDFFRDQAKFYNDFLYLSKVKEYQSYLMPNFESAKDIADSTTTPFEPEEDVRHVEGDVTFDGSFKFFNNIFVDINQFVKENAQFVKENNSTVVLKARKYNFDKTIIIPRNLKLRIEPGAELSFYPGVSFVSYSPIQAIGTNDRPILIKANDLKNKKAWGVFALINTGDEVNNFENVIVSGGSSDTINGVFYTSQFSLHNTVSNIRNSSFSNSKSDDGMHAILGKVFIEECTISNNNSDGIDFDFLSDGYIINSTFNNIEHEGSNGDAIDLSGTGKMLVENNKISNYGDKGVSVGENANARIINNLISNNNIGVAVKDKSIVEIINNVIMDNRESGVAAYRKKQVFVDGGDVKMENSVLWQNGQDIFIDKYSTIKMVDVLHTSEYKKGGDIKVNLEKFNFKIPEELSFIK